MNTLQGAAANSAAANGAAAPAAAAAPATAAPAAAEVVTQDAAVTQLLDGMGKKVVTTAKRDPIDEDAYHLAALNAEIETKKMVRETADDLIDEDEDLDFDEVEEDEYKRDVGELEGEVYRFNCVMF